MLTDRKALGFRDVLIQPQPSSIKSRKEVSLKRTFRFKNGQEITCVPIIASNMKNIGTWTVANILGGFNCLTCLHKDMTIYQYLCIKETAVELFDYIIPTVGLNDWDTLDGLIGLPIKMICLDVANGYMEQFVDFVHDVMYNYPPHWIIMAGNVATAEGAERLYEAGADIVKVGLGSGSVCTTRFKTGVGVPQVTAIDDICNKKPINETYFRTKRGLVCSDGGCTNPGDVAKAFVAGADFVMLGGMFAGTKETGAVYSGEAYNCVEDYKTSEGKKVIYQNFEESLSNRIKDILGGLRSCGSYIGQKSIKDFYRADLIQVSEQTNDIFGRPE